MAKMFDGKKVYDRESFSYELAKIGDYVTEEVVDDAINCLPRWAISPRKQSPQYLQTSSATFVKVS